jgi:hypothetical protein
MINPTISALLAGVATSLDETVLPELPTGAARNQLVAAIAIIRRAAAVGDRIPSYLNTDNHDIAAVLADIGPSLGLSPPAVALPPASLPSIDELRQINATMQELVVEAHRRARTQSSAEPARLALRALYARMLERESQINTTSWA